MLRIVHVLERLFVCGVNFISQEKPCYERNSDEAD
jgi:hypothetical protein